MMVETTENIGAEYLGVVETPEGKGWMKFFNKKIFKIAAGITVGVGTPAAYHLANPPVVEAEVESKYDTSALIKEKEAAIAERNKENVKMNQEADAKIAKNNEEIRKIKEDGVRKDEKDDAALIAALAADNPSAYLEKSD